MATSEFFLHNAVIWAHFLLGALDFVDITKLEKKKIVYWWLFLQPIFVLKKQARKQKKNWKKKQCPMPVPTIYHQLSSFIGHYHELTSGLLK